jgi:L-iditol 2-dehydrogenase
MKKAIAVISPARGLVELSEKEVGAPGKTEIQVRVHVSLISPGTERAFILGLDNTKKSYPFVPGYCSTGIVEETGEEVDDFKVGDRVACYVLGHQTVGNVDRKWAKIIPEGISFEEASFLPIAVTSMQAVRKARIEIGESVMVLGLGLIGQFALQFAKINGAMPLIAVDRAENRMQIAITSGADNAINTNDANWRDLLRETCGADPRVVIESTGFPDAVGTALQSVGQYGRVILLGSTRGESTVNFYQDIHCKGATVIGAHLGANPKFESQPGSWTWKENTECFMKFLQAGRLQVKQLISETIQMEQIVDTYKNILTWNTGLMGSVIKWI